MANINKLKTTLGALYLIIISVFLWLFFSNFSINEVTSYEFIKNNRYYLIQIKNSKIFLSSILFFMFVVFWTVMLGFGSPIVLIGGFIYGKWLGSILALFGLTVGGTLLYVFANFYLKDFIEEKFSKKFIHLNEKFRKNEFTFFLIYRFIGGVPFSISNIIPTLFNINVKNFFFGSLLGMYPQIFIWASLGSGIEKIIGKNIEPPSFYDLLFSEEIYLPVIGFIIIVLLSLIIKKFFYQN